MKFNLKSFLVLICVVGATVGVMSRLLLTQPEMFLEVLRLGATVGPFLLAVATIVWIGIRGAMPSRRLVLWGCGLLVAPFVAILAISLLLPAGNPLQLLSTKRLIDHRLPGQIDTPWVWQELERRLAAGKLSNQDVDRAAAVLIAHMRRTSPAGWNQPFPWQRGFLQQAIQRNQLSEDALLDLCNAFFGPTPIVEITTPMLNEDDTRFSLSVRYGNPWADNSGIDVQLVWDVKLVRLDGNAVSVGTYQKHFGREASMTVEAPLPPGEHELVVEFDCAFVDAATLAGTDLGTLTADQWPRPRKRWTSAVHVPLQVAPAADAADDPQR